LRLVFRNMLVAISATDGDASLLQHAAMLERLIPGLAIHGVHIAAPDQTPPPCFLHDRYSPVLPKASWEIFHGDVLDCLIDCAASRGADVLLLGHSGRHGKRSLARRLAMKAPCSVWMVPDGSPPSLNAILAPVDLSKPSADTLDLATALAERAGLDECCALHIYFNDALVTFEEFEEVLMENKEKAFDLFVAPINLHGVHARPLFIESAHVAQTIVNVAKERRFDLIVMGTRGRSASAAVLLGSETEQVIIDTTVPVLAVKHRGARLRLRQALADDRVRRRPDQRYS
jgi:SulP family sulfate permease